MAVTARPGVNQWAEMARIASGLGRSAAIRRQALLLTLRSSVFIGVPWPTNNAGMELGMVAGTG
jgi:hypothetical protein